MQNLCRICLKESSSLISLDDQKIVGGKLLKYREMYIFCLRLYVSSDDGISQQICRVCGDLLVKFFEMAKTAAESVKVLREKLGKVNVGFHILEDRCDDEGEQNLHLNTQYEEEDIIESIDQEQSADDAQPIQSSNNDILMSCSICDLDFPESEILSHIYTVHENETKSEEEVAEAVEIASENDHWEDVERLYEVNEEELSSSGPCERANTGAIIEQVQREKPELETTLDKSGFVIDECPMCNQRVKRLKDHMKTKHGQPICCDMCEEQMETEKLLREHQMKVHGKCQMYICSECPLLLKTVGALNKYLKLHDKTKQYKYECEICNKKFYFKDYYKNHLVTHTNQKLSCSLCEKSFKRKSSLKAHMKWHYTGGEFECEVCNKKFVYRSMLESHMRFHQRNYDYQCDKCEKRFQTRQHLTAHSTTHTGLKHKCPRCDKSFQYISGLREHRYVHIGMPFSCNICGKQFPAKNKLRAHYEKSHKIRPKEEEMIRMPVGDLKDLSNNDLELEVEIETTRNVQSEESSCVVGAEVCEVVNQFGADEGEVVYIC